ncbi:MAG: hypothetical protein K9M45_08280, partial [Kiritimatiellales bacterium]|nr:hypothetical protein [Kiritimatiellales bacterium]
GGEWGLYDMEADRNETTDLKDKHPETFAELVKLHEEWAKPFGGKQEKTKKSKSKKKKGK